MKTTIGVDRGPKSQYDSYIENSALEWFAVPSVTQKRHNKILWLDFPTLTAAREFINIVNLKCFDTEGEEIE